MDTKQLFMKTQINLINWALIVGGVFFALSLYFCIITRFALTNLFPFIGNTFIFASLIWVRFKLQINAAKALLFSFGALFLYYLVTFFIGLPKLIQGFKVAAQTSSLTLIILGSLIGYTIYFLCGFLYYKVYKATRLIQEMQKESLSDHSES